MEKTSFVFYLSWHKILVKYSAQIRCEVYDAIMEYVSSGTLSTLKPQAQMAFDFIKGELDKNLEKFESKIESRKKAANERWKKRDAKNANASDAMQNKKCMNLHSEDEDEDEDVSSNEDIKETIPKGIAKKVKLSLGVMGIQKIFSEYEKTAQDESYIKFLRWSKENTPYIARHLQPVSEEQFLKLKGAYGSEIVRVCMENLENRKDIRKKYSNLYRTLLNWCKNESEKRD